MFLIFLFKLFQNVCQQIIRNNRIACAQYGIRQCSSQAEENQFSALTSFTEEELMLKDTGNYYFAYNFFLCQKIFQKYNKF